MPRGMPATSARVAKVDEMHFDAVLHDSHDEDHYHLKPLDFPPPMHGLAIEPERRGDEQRLVGHPAQADRRRSRACASSTTPR